MIRKAQLLNEDEKLKREVFIWIHIGVGTNSSIKEKEIAVKSFLETNPNFNSYEVCNTIELNRGTYYNFVNHGVEKI